MSSLSLPRVLQQRKTSLEQERENFEKSQAISINKAINQAESPVKEKHVRRAILGTFHEKCAETFWAVVLRLPLQDNRITAWKFCHVLHKVLREGHPQTLRDSIVHVSMIGDIGKLWGHLRDCYGKLIQEYCSLLCVKINFHRRNPRIPGNLVLSSNDLDAIGENDVNNYFQLSVEMFDYMDEILTLQKSIFSSLDKSRSNSMTTCGQCRLAPLIPMIQDSNQLYDCCVKLMFKLHASLPQDLLSGHRSRFLDQFKKLRAFYVAASVLQYFKTLIQVPSLPESSTSYISGVVQVLWTGHPLENVEVLLETRTIMMLLALKIQEATQYCLQGGQALKEGSLNPPNFLIQSELGSYETPVVILPPEEEMSLDSIDTPSTGELVDLNSPISNGNTSPDIIAERDSLIEHLQNELSRCRTEMTKLVIENQKKIRELCDRIASLETQLITKESELEQERLCKEDLQKQIEVASLYHESEKRAKAIEEKFQKLKEVYTKLREEHIQLIRQKADVDKQLINLRSVELDSCEKAKLEDLAYELSSLQASADAATEQNQALEAKLLFVTKEKMQVESELHDLLSQKEDLDVKLQMAKSEAKEQHKNFNDLLSKIFEQSEEIVRHAIHEVDNPAFSSATCSVDYFCTLSSGIEEVLPVLEAFFRPELVIRLAYRTAGFVLHGKAASNTSPDIEFGERMGVQCKTVGEVFLDHLQKLRGMSPIDLSLFRKSVFALLDMANHLQNNVQRSSESVEDLVESELAAMDKAIEEAAKKIEEMLSNSRKADSGLKLEVNEKILDSCTGLMHAIRILVQKSRVLQAEIVVQGKGTASAKEFYKRNHQWTEGLISAAKAVGIGAKYLLEAADDVVSADGKIEMVMAAAQGISASTAQLVVASRVKAERDSNSLMDLTVASRGVTQATAGVLTSAKACVQLVEQSDDLDLSGLTLHNAKRLEMESQVKLLELENALAKERLRLSALRRQHYLLAPESEQVQPM